MGRKVAEFIKDFLTNYRSVQESGDMLPLPVNINKSARICIEYDK